MSEPMHDRDCASVTTRFAYCDCALSTRGCRTLAQLAAAAPLERARRERDRAILDRLSEEYEYATDPTTLAVLDVILTGRSEDL